MQWCPMIPGMDDDALRRYGTHFVGGSGAGKSRYLGRLLAFYDFLRRIPVIVIDASKGSTIDNFLHKLLLYCYELAGTLPADQAQETIAALWRRVTYVNMAGLDGNVIPLPILCPFPNETYAACAVRFVDTIRRVYPGLESAQVQGMPPLQHAAVAAGQILLSLGGSILDMSDLIRHPDPWIFRIKQLAQTHPRLPRLLDELLSVKHTETLLSKLSLFTLDDTMGAIYGA